VLSFEDNLKCPYCRNNLNQTEIDNLTPNNMFYNIFLYTYFTQNGDIDEANIYKKEYNNLFNKYGYYL
jgi:hypothetical protein